MNEIEDEVDDDAEEDEGEKDEHAEDVCIIVECLSMFAMQLPLVGFPKLTFCSTLC
jgi:hypothetical protein